jgi:hypothetical protein
VQLIGATLAALILHAVINVSATYGSNYPAADYCAAAAFWMELILTTGLVSVILGTASGAQNVGIIAAFGVGENAALRLAVLCAPVRVSSLPARWLHPGNTKPAVVTRTGAPGTAGRRAMVPCPARSGLTGSGREVLTGRNAEARPAGGRA